MISKKKWLCKHVHEIKAIIGGSSPPRMNFRVQCCKNSFWSSWINAKALYKSQKQRFLNRHMTTISTTAAFYSAIPSKSRMRASMRLELTVLNFSITQEKEHSRTLLHIIASSIWALQKVSTSCPRGKEICIMKKICQISQFCPLTNVGLATRQPPKTSQQWQCIHMLDRFC